MNNGNRYVIDTEGVKHDLNRDIDKLMHNYRNLRYALYYRYSNHMDNYVKKEELLEYINEQFIKLVKEYNIHSEVDFPYYIKSKLTMRVRNSYVKKNKDRDANVVFGNDNDTLETIIESNGSELGMSDLVSYLFEGIEFTDIENELLIQILTNEENIDDPNIVSKVAHKLEIPRKEVTRTLTELKDFIRFKLHAHEEQNKDIDIVKGRVNTDNNTWEM